MLNLQYNVLILWDHLHLIFLEFLGTLMFVFFGAGTASHFGADLPLELTAVSAAHGGT